MATIADLGSSKFLKQADVEPPILVTMDGYKKQNVAKEDDAPQNKYVLFFKETDKGLVLNATNGQLIADIVGSPDLDQWEGKKVVLFNDPSVFYAGKKTGGVRVRAPKSGGKGKAVPEEKPEDALTDEDVDKIPF